ncbi:hypothetical protein FRB99_002283 [Tulasnella sp. 403]|nr:hypothetical protein FRB99_002283 [Tulasnella sp. 403]
MSTTDIQNPLGPAFDESPLFLPSCTDCEFCDGLRDFDEKRALSPIELEPDKTQHITVTKLFKTLPFLDRWLPVLIVLAMVTGLLIGVYAEQGVHKAFDGAQWKGVSIPVLVGLLLMMWPVLTKVQYESLPALFSSREIWIHIGISFILNWIVAPFIMLGLAWATLPESSLERERKGVILVGIARCIAMVLIWTGLAKGDAQYCAVLVGLNSLLQIVLFAPYSLLFLNVLGSGRASDTPKFEVSYSQVSTSVGIYLGIPLAAGFFTRFVMKNLLAPRKFSSFLQRFGPLALVGLLYTIIVLFANQGKRIVDDVGSVFRIFVPLVLYFALVWFTTFFGLWFLSRGLLKRRAEGYDKIVVQAFTAGSNNFELAIAVAVANFGTESPEALAATIGPLVEVGVPFITGCTHPG